MSKILSPNGSKTDCPLLSLVHRLQNLPDHFNWALGPGNPGSEVGPPQARPTHFMGQIMHDQNSLGHVLRFIYHCINIILLKNVFKLSLKEIYQCLINFHNRHHALNRHQHFLIIFQYIIHLLFHRIHRIANIPEIFLMKNPSPVF